jgi:hypothetical protein
MQQPRRQVPSQLEFVDVDILGSNALKMEGTVEGVFFCIA